VGITKNVWVVMPKRAGCVLNVGNIISFREMNIKEKKVREWEKSIKNSEERKEEKKKGGQNWGSHCTKDGGAVCLKKYLKGAEGGELSRKKQPKKKKGGEMGGNPGKKRKLLRG